MRYHGEQPAESGTYVVIWEARIIFVVYELTQCYWVRGAGRTETGARYLILDETCHAHAIVGEVRRLSCGMDKLYRKLHSSTTL